MEIEINSRPIGPKHSPYIIAEISANHNGSLSRALELILRAKACGVSAVKLQTFTPDTITLDHDGPGFVIESGLWKGRRLFDLYKEAQTPWDWHPKIFEYCRSIGLTVFSSPFDETAVDFLESLGAPAYKIASPEIVDTPLIKKAAKTGKPLIMSCGMASIEEISEAVAIAKSYGSGQIALLHCVSAYPTEERDANLATIPELAKRFNVLSGLSDHSTHHRVAVLSVGTGATIVEKHFIMSREEGGLDSAFSLEPDEMKILVDECNRAFEIRGDFAFQTLSAETQTKKLRRSLYVVKDKKKGDVIQKSDIKSIRPSFGISPKYLDRVIGSTATRDLNYGDPLTFDMFS
jgi:pseudaminic acid synthase